MSSWIVRLLPVLLVVASWLVGWALAGTLTDRGAMLWALLPSALLVCLRGVLERYVAPEVSQWSFTSSERRPNPRGGMIWLAVHTVVLVWALWLNPLTCVYAFVGYLDADRLLRGRQMVPLVVLTALMCAFGQTGGIDVIVRAPLLLVGLALVNLLVSAAMLYLANQHEREVDARERAAIELERISTENAQLQDELVDRARERGMAAERARLSREIHDTVAQGLVGVIHQLEAVPEGGLDPAARQRISRAEAAARDSLLEARRAVQALAPRQLADADLVQALHEITAPWARTHRIVTTFDSDEAPTRPTQGAVLLRVAQEALSNIARHADASAVTLRLRAEGDDEVLEICDDGKGFEPEQVVRGHGLDSMAGRVREVGGRLQVRSRPGAGCRIVAVVPRAGDPEMAQDGHATRDPLPEGVPR